MIHDTGILNMLEFDIAIYVFALFQLGLINLIIFKLNFKYMDRDLVTFTALILLRRIVCKASHYYQVNIYRVSQLQFTVLRSVPLAICLVILWHLIKIAIFNSLVNLLCVLLPTIMYCVIFGVPRGIFSMSIAAYMQHPIYCYEKPVNDKGDSSSSTDAKKDADKVQ